MISMSQQLAAYTTDMPLRGSRYRRKLAPGLPGLTSSRRTRECSVRESEDGADASDVA